MLRMPVNGVDQEMEIIPMNFSYNTVQVKYGEYYFWFRRILN